MTTVTISPQRFHELAQQIEAEVSKVIVGQNDIIRQTLISIVLGRHTLLEGVPGLGKTLLIRTLSQVLQLHFNRIQFTPDLMPSDIVGTDILTETAEGKREFRFQAGPIFANLVLADEINRATPKTQSAMLEVMQEKSVTVGGTTYALELPFFVLATQNPIEQEGTYPLPEAQLDRFIFKLNLNPPTASELVTILERTTATTTPTVRSVATAAELIAMNELVLGVPVPSHVIEYVVRLIVATHPSQSGSTPNIKQFVRYGASPRGAQAIILGAKATALMGGRYNVSFEDVLSVMKPALRHRLLLNFDGLAEGVATDALIDELANSLPKNS
ncbi:MAG: AAA family ATPase [Phototrophicaceae bacterium]